VSPSTGSGSSSSRTTAAVVLAVIAIVFIVVGIIYLAEPASSLPGFIPGHAAGSTGHHPLRAAGTLIVGVIFAVGAWFALKYKGKASAPAGSATKEPVNH
jgi:amino acid permease